MCVSVYDDVNFLALNYYMYKALHLFKNMSLHRPKQTWTRNSKTPKHFSKKSEESPFAYCHLHTIVYLKYVMKEFGIVRCELLFLKLFIGWVEPP